MRDSPEPVDREFANALTTVGENETPLWTELREYFRNALMPSENLLSSEDEELN